MKRKHDPFKDCWAFPGGFVDYGENPEKSVLRELEEETNLKGTLKRLVGVYGEGNWDPWKHVVTIVYEINVSNFNEMKALDDAKEVNLFDLEKIKNQSSLFAFDHYIILTDWISKFAHSNLDPTMDTK